MTKAGSASSITAPVVALQAPQDDLRLARTLPPNDPLRLRIEAASDVLEVLAAAIIRELDKVGIDPDLEDDEREDVSEDEGAQVDHELTLGRSENFDQSRREFGSEDEGSVYHSEGI